MAYVPVEQRRAQLVAAALRVLSREGVVGATTRRIADEAGVQVGTVHYCFTDKEELFAAVMDHLTDELLGAGGGAPLPDGDLVAMLRSGLDVLWPVVGADRGKQAVGYELTLTAMRTPRLEGRARQQYAACLAAVETFLRRVAAGAGLPLPDGEPARLARWVVATVDGAVLQLVVTGDEAAAYEVLDTLVGAVATRIQESAGAAAPAALPARRRVPKPAVPPES